MTPKKVATVPNDRFTEVYLQWSQTTVETEIGQRVVAMWAPIVYRQPPKPQKP